MTVTYQEWQQKAIMVIINVDFTADKWITFSHNGESDKVMVLVVCHLKAM